MEIRNNQHQIKVLKVNIQRKRRRKHLYLLYFIFLSSLDIMCQGNADTNQLLKGCCQAHCVPSEWAPPAKSCPLHVGHRTDHKPTAICHQGRGAAAFTDLNKRTICVWAAEPQLFIDF